MTVYAHSLAKQPEAEWEPLGDHLHAVSARAAAFAAAFGRAGAAGVAGLLHDVGKVSAQFQSYIRAAPPVAGAEHVRGGDHSSAGARIAVERYGQFGRLLAFGIVGHHAGLADGSDLDRRLDETHRKLPPYHGWERHAGTLPTPRDLAPTAAWRKLEKHKGYSQAFLVRMLFSCLVDADFLETERFYATAAGAAPARGQDVPLASLLDRLRAHQAQRQAKPTPLNRLRAEVLDHAIGRAAVPPGLFTLTVPTGGGKTLTSLRFALEHAVRHGLRRVIYVIPYTSIIEQTATVFRAALDSDDSVLEHHASFDWEAAGRKPSDDGQEQDGLAALRRAAANWDVPVVVTTAVQFFESLYAARTSRCRKLHNLAGSVIVLDEAQTMPLGLLQPCLAALDELCLNYRASAVLCTATQPAVRCQDGFKRGLDIPAERELAPDPPGLPENAANESYKDETLIVQLVDLKNTVHDTKKGRIISIGPLVRLHTSTQGSKLQGIDFRSPELNAACEQVTETDAFVAFNTLGQIRVNHHETSIRVDDAPEPRHAGVVFRRFFLAKYVLAKPATIFDLSGHGLGHDLGGIVLIRVECAATEQAPQNVRRIEGCRMGCDPAACVEQEIDYRSDLAATMPVYSPASLNEACRRKPLPERCLERQIHP